MNYHYGMYFTRDGKTLIVISLTILAFVLAVCR